MNDAQLREAYAQLLARRSGQSVAVPLDRLRALAEGSVSEAERAELLDAVLADPQSRREYELLRAIASGNERRPRRFGWLVAAAALIALTTVTSKQLMRPAPEVMRGGGGELVLVSPEDGAALGGNQRFVWRSVPDAESYVLEIASEEGELAFRAAGVDTVMTVPDTVSGAGPWRWWVTAALADGSEMRSPLRALSGR